MNTILYFYPSNSSFIRTDVELLSKSFTVKQFFFNGRRKILTPWLFIKQFLFLLVHGWHANVFISHFAGYHSLLPSVIGKILGTPSIIIIAGTDAYCFPSIRYGNFTKKTLGFFTCLSLRLCTQTCPVHKTLVLCDYSYTSDDNPKQGYLSFCKSAQHRFTEIHYGFDHERFFLTGEKRIPSSFLTVTQTIKNPVYYRKGIDLIIETAKRFPDYSFLVVGKDKEPDIEISHNIQFIPPMPFEQLVNYYNRYEFYFQLSIAEGFPNALCEAMLCGCIPIGSAVAAIPDIIGQTGFILKKKNIDALEKIIKQAVNCDKNQLSTLAHEKIRNHYTLEKRAAELVKVIKLNIP